MDDTPDRDEPEDQGPDPDDARAEMHLRRAEARAEEHGSWWWNLDG